MPNVAAPQNPLSQPLAWDLVSDGYVEELVPVFERFAERALDMASVRAGSRVLDVATGPGTLALVAAGRGADVTAVDFSTAMIERLRGRAAARGLTVRAMVGDGQALELPDASFDAAFSMLGVIFFPDRARGLRELSRVLAPGGEAVISSWPPLDRAPVLAAVFGSLRALLPGLPLGGGPPPLGDPTAIRDELGAAGLVDVRVEEMTVAHEFPTVRDAWASIARSTAPLVLLRRTLGVDASRELEARLLADLVGRFGSGPVRLDAVAYLSSGRRAH